MESGVVRALGSSSAMTGLHDRVIAPARTLRAMFTRFWPLTRPDRPTLLGAGLLLIVAAAADTVAVLMFMDIIDGVVSSGKLSGYWEPAGIWASVAVAGAVATACGSYLLARAGERFLLRLRDTTFAHLQRLPPHFFAQHPAGDLVARLSGDIEEIETLVSAGVVQGVTAGVSVVFFGGAVFWLRWDLALVVIALLPALLLLTRRVAKGFRVTAQDERLSNGAISDVVEQGVSNVALAQAYATEQVEAERLHEQGRAWMRARLAQMRLTAVYTPTTDLLESLCVLTVLGVGVWEITQGRLTIGGLVAFSTFLGFLYTPIHSLSSLFLTMSAARASSDRVSEVLDAVPAVTDLRRAWVEPARHGRLDLAHVGFSYPAARRPSLTDVTLSTRPGQLVLLTGPSGAGKSTVAGLLMRFYDPTGGRVLLDGVDLRDYSLSALRHSITLLPQQAAIVDGTVAENIAYGSPGASKRQIGDAARAAQAESFIQSLPRGYDTRLGSHGTALSGGQRQRIAIARALLRDTPVIVLDEPTAGLDGPAAAALVPALRALIRGRTTILITHDLTLAPSADAVLVLDNGRLVEHGTHHQLIERGGLYRHLQGRHDPAASLIA